MKNIIGLILIVLTISACGKKSKDNIAYRVTEKDLIPEGITYSATTNSFYISSIYKTKIVQIDAESGEFKDFIPFDLVDARFVGMITDDSRNHLWACGNIVKNGKRHSTVSKFDLKTSKLLKIYSYPDTLSHTYNDLVIDKEGNAYFTDSNNQNVYKIDKKTDLVTIFYDSEEIAYPNGITISPDNKYLYIASSHGVRVLDIEKQEIIGEVDDSFDSKGLDGMKYYKNSIIGIQNYIKDTHKTKIARYYLDESGTKITKMEIIDQNNPLFDIPTTFVIVPDHLYCMASSQLDNIKFPESEIINPEELKDILILKYELK